MRKVGKGELSENLGVIIEIINDQVIQTGFREIWLINSQSVNPIQPGKSKIRHGLSCRYIFYIVSHKNTTNEWQKQCDSWN